MSRARAAALAAAVAWLLAGAVPADEILLASGTTLEGQVETPKCQRCGGSGRSTCANCRGTGTVSGPGGAKQDCLRCRRTGQQTCPDCDGLGISAATVRIRLKAGVITEIDRKDIRGIAWKRVDPESVAGVKETYAKRAAALDQNSAAQNFELAEWCMQKGLEAEARQHLDAAVRLDPAKYTKAAAPHLAELARRREKAAVKALLAALAALEREGYAKGLPAVRAVMQDYPETELLRRGELQRDLIRQHFPKLAEAGRDTLERVLAAAADAEAAQCPVCAGRGRAACPACRGTGEGACPACSGSGKRNCPVCDGTRRLTCPECYGEGTRRGGAMGYGDRVCQTCRGVGEVGCDVCAAGAKVPCRACTGAGRVAGTCPVCKGARETVCAACDGSGVRRVDRLKWGPPPVRQAGAVKVAGAGARTPAWQGDCGGAVITVVPAEALWRGALGKTAAALAKSEIRLVAVALDNRNGTRMLRFRPASGTVRGVTADAGQFQQADLAKLLADSKDDRQAKLLAAAAADADCLPGAYVCVLAAFPAGTDLSRAANLFWVQGNSEPTKLSPIWFSADEVEDLRKSLRE